MQKPNSLRKALTDAVPVLRTNPDMLHLRLDDGNNTATLARSLSYEKRYTLNVVVTDFTDDIDLLFVPIMAWLRVNQPDIMTTDEGRNKGFAWYADINNDRQPRCQHQPVADRAHAGQRGRRRDVR
ncbi:P2 phage tail completion protein R (GpR) [Raoultella terrigena]|uniref:P2 phage tail completion protein R (GpR) n=1 Tax=Raoultella terrigena TaxID=577 RepID=A0A3P8LZN1_RAOTE|nr:P2 phage tail completion protein R (GpR) [Raoultella terrigena]